jgi:two-component system phosphate regulon sensor histidine kinase PhoR
MARIVFPDAVPSAEPAVRSVPSIGGDADQSGSNFSATLLAMAGHDLRQPLQVITSAHDVLVRNLYSEEQLEKLMRADQATKRVAIILGQLVEALQMRERSGDDLHLPVPLRPILEDLTTEFAEAAQLKGITFLVTATRQVAFSHPVLLAGILRNLIRNAIDYTPPGGGVFVTSRRCGTELRIEVRDTGIGIRANTLSRNFSAFQRTNAAPTDGLGLGLFIVQRAADLLGHQVEVGSIEGRGLCFSVMVSAA